MNIYLDQNDFGKTISYTEENGKKQNLYAHDHEGFVIKSLEDHDKEKRNELIDEIKKELDVAFETIYSNNDWHYIGKFKDILDQLKLK